MFLEFRDGPYGYWCYTNEPRHFTIIADTIVEDLKNDIIDTMADICVKWNCVPTAEDTVLIQEECKENSPLASLTVDLFVHMKTDNLVESTEGNW